MGVSFGRAGDVVSPPFEGGRFGRPNTERFSSEMTRPLREQQQQTRTTALVAALAAGVALSGCSGGAAQPAPDETVIKSTRPAAGVTRGDLKKKSGPPSKTRGAGG